MPNQRRPDQYKKYVEHIAVQFYRSLYLPGSFQIKEKDDIIYGTGKDRIQAFWLDVDG